MGVVFGSMRFLHPYHKYNIAIKTYLFEDNKRKYIIKDHNKYVVFKLKDDKENNLFTFESKDTHISMEDIDKLVLVVSKVVEGESTIFTEEDINNELIKRRQEVELALNSIHIIE